VPVDTPDPSQEAFKVTNFDDDGNEIKADDLEVTDEGEQDANEAGKEPEMKTITKQVWDWEVINEIKAIWLRDPADITEEEYNGFYKTITKEAEDPLAYSHFTAEGEIDFKAILYIPGTAPFDLFENYYQKSSALKLYVRRVLITDTFEDLMPKYLSFVKGVVDSDDLPLNVSREQLQQMKMIKVMSKKLVRKTIEMIKDLAEEGLEDDDEEDDGDAEEEEAEEQTEEDDAEAEEEDEEEEHKIPEKYKKFWNNFGKSIKLGVIEDSSNRLKLAKLLRFKSTNDPEELTSLDEYISRMKED